MKLHAATGPRRFRSIFISDVHLGTRECRAEFLLEFLRHSECERLYLVGDIVDLQAMRRSVHWPDEHGEVVRQLLARARAGTVVTYIPGNHDEPLRACAGLRIGAIEIAREALHVTADGRRLLVVHGDQFDPDVQCPAWLASLGELLYDFILPLSHRLHRLRVRLGLSYWSLAAFLKQNVANAATYVRQFEEAVAREARRRGVDGVVCGHIHRAAIVNSPDTVYLNGGDWVESCTALVEHCDGSFEVLHWSDRQRSLVQMNARRAAA